MGMEQVVEQIKYDGQLYPAAYCERCKSKMWPAELLAAHQQRHRDKDDLFDITIRPVRKALTRMRNT